jgi:CBS domain-containing protein
MTTASATASFPALTGLRVIDAMHPGLISCSPATPLQTVARMMATYRVHAVLVTGHGEETLGDGGPWGIVSDTELLRASSGHDIGQTTARDAALTPAHTIASSDALGVAAELMAAHDASHLVVVEQHSGRPIGVLSTLDVARALAGFPERHPVHV